MKYFIIIITSLLLFACNGKKKVAMQESDAFYTCSMHPQVMQNGPGKCPICEMDLIKVEKKGENKDAIMLSDQQIQLGNIRVDTVGKEVIADQTILPATINLDETKTATISARISGRIEKLYFKNEGDYVQKGARLYDLYSEQLNNAKQEYILALEKQETLDNSIVDIKQLVQSAKTKLLLWGMSESQIDDLAKTRKASALTPFYSTASGYITALESHEGDYVTEGGTIVRVGNLSSVWVEAQIFTFQLAGVDLSGAATVRLPGLGKEANGKIQFVNPEINPDTRINLVRMVVANPKNELKPGMQAYVALKNRRRNSLTLPVDAVLRGEKMNMIWIQIDKNTFKGVMVDVGLENDDRIEIKKGLKVGDVVVTSGAYLLNSEYIFKKGANPMGGHDMNNMKM